MSELRVADTESCEVDFVTAVDLGRRRPGEEEGIDLRKFVGRCLFLPKRSSDQ